MALIKKNWLVILFGSVCLALLFLLIRGCNNQPSHKDESKAVVDTVAIVQAREVAFKIEKDSLVKNEQKWKNVADSVSRQLIVTKNKAAKAANNISHLVTIGEAFKMLKDTVELLKNRDSLISEAMVQGDVVVDLITQYDSLLTVKDSIINIKDQLLVKQDKLHSDLRISFSKVTDDYSGLYKDYKKAQWGKKFNKTLVRIESAAVLVLGGIIYFHK